MNREDFSNGFDTLVSSFAHRYNFGDETSLADVAFDEYEKSFFLTKAQESLVIAMYNGGAGNSFEETEEMRRYLANLVIDATLTPKDKHISSGVSSNSKFFDLPLDKNDNSLIWFITYEAVSVDGIENCDSLGSLDVIPVTQDEYHKIKKNPFRGANYRRALRLDLPNNQIEIVCNKNITSYYVRGLRKPKPIILIDLPDGLTVDNESKASDPVCELHEALHNRILEAAVLMALQSKGYTRGSNDNKETKQRSN